MDEIGNDNKKKILLAVIGVIVSIAIIFGLYVLTTSSKKNGGQQSATSSATKVVTQKPTAPTPPPVTTVKDSVLRSTDGGDSFLPYFTVAVDKKNIGPADVISISFHPSVSGKVMVTTSDDGLFVNEGDGNLWSPVPFPPKKIYSLILDRNSPDNRVFASGIAEGNGRIFRTDNAGVDWKAVYAEPGNGTYVSRIAQHPDNLNLILAGTSKGTIIKSVDAGSSWKNTGSKIDGTITNFVFDSSNKLFSYLLSVGHSIYFSRDDGTTWTNWATEKKNEVDALKKRAQELTREGNKTEAKRLTDQANALSKRNTENKEPTGILLFVSDPARSGTIYAGASGGLYRSTDFGKYWTKINIIESAEKFPIRSIAVNPKNSSEIVFVSGKSFYKSINGGDTWSVTPLTMTRNASLVAYDPFDPTIIYIGASSK